MMTKVRSGLGAVLMAVFGISTVVMAAGPSPDELVIDVRTPAEFAGGHYPGATNIPFDVIDSRIKALTSDRDQPIALYCRSGRRSGIALQTLEAMGFTRVTNYGGLSDISAP